MQDPSRPDRVYYRDARRRLIPCDVVVFGDECACESRGGGMEKE